MIPRTLLARTFLLLAALVILTTTAWLSVFRYIEAEPRARETAQLAASTVNLIRAALFAAAPEKRPELFNELSTREGIRLLPAEAEDKIEAMPDSRFNRLIQRELAARLGAHTRIAAEVDGVAGFWVSFRLDERDDVLEAVKAGATGYLVKSASKAELADARRDEHVGRIACKATTSDPDLHDVDAGADH